ncbi:MAG TPA: hypothetical protein VL123_02375 [Candidatus Udaeobacter sp.]|jgi:hypothetical protein|nr:hypothetical protein [Candidatus Udaeobacter sp.]
MTRHDTTRPPEPKAFPRRSGPGPGLRLKLWLGCLGGSLLAAAGVAVLMWRRGELGPYFDAELHWVWLPATLGAGVLVSFLFAIWLDRRIVGHVRGLTRSFADGQVAELRGLPSSSGWGDLSELTIQAQAVLARQRHLLRVGAESEVVRDHVLRTRDAVERWSRSGTWETLPPGSDALSPLIAVLNREFSRINAGAATAREAGHGLAQGLGTSADEVREVAEQTERGFVEATALLTTVRELERLSGELDSALRSPEAAVESGPDIRALAADAIGRLILASSESVAHLADGMRRVQEIGAQTRVISNRATVLALTALAGRERSGAPAPEGGGSDELEALAAEVREAERRVDQLTKEIEDEAATARDRMAAAQNEVAGVLGAAAPEPGPVEVHPHVARIEERMHEMIRDAAVKGERLSAAGERASRAAEALRRRMESGLEEIERLITMLGGAPSLGAGDAGPARFQVIGRAEVDRAHRITPESRGNEEERA